MTWVFAAFLTVWIAVFIFLMKISRAQQVLSQEIAALKSSKR
jgi:CcmD family protein